MFRYRNKDSIDKFLKKNDWDSVIFIDPMHQRHYGNDEDLHFTFEMFEHIAMLLTTNKLKTLILFNWDWADNINIDERGLEILEKALLLNFSLETLGIQFCPVLLDCLCELVKRNNNNLKALHVKDVYDCGLDDNIDYSKKINSLSDAIVFENNNLLNIVIHNLTGEEPQYNDKCLLIDYGNFGFISYRNKYLLDQKKKELAMINYCIRKSFIKMAQHIHDDFIDFFNKIKRPIVYRCN